MLHLWLLYGASNEAISLEKNCRFTYNLEIGSNKNLPGDPMSSIHSVLLFKSIFLKVILITLESLNCSNKEVLLLFNHV